MQEKLLIIGIDPGTTLGYAILDIDGRLIKLNSSKNINLSHLISTTINEGYIAVVSTDKKNVPFFVESFATKVGARIVHPKQDLLVKEKRKLTNNYKTKDYHQMDALASSLFAFKELKPLLRKINVFVKNHKKEKIKNEIKKLVLLKGMSIRDAVELIEKPVEEEIIIKKVVEEKRLDEKDFLKIYDKLKRAKKDVEFLKQQNTNLKRELFDLKNTFANLSKKIDKLKSDEELQKIIDFKEQRLKSFEREVRLKDEEIDLLQGEKVRLISLLSDLNKNYILKKLDNLGYKELERKNLLLNIQNGDMILVDDANIVSEKTIELLKNKISIVVHKKPISKKIKGLLPFVFIDGKRLRIRENKHFALVNKKDLEREKKNVDLIAVVVKNYRNEKILKNKFSLV